MIFRRGTWLFRQRKGKSKQYSQEGHERGLQICKGIAQEFKKPFPAVLSWLSAILGFALRHSRLRYRRQPLMEKNYWNPWYCHTLLFDCFLHTSILSSLLQCSTVFIPHTVVSLCYVKCVRRGSVTKLTSESRLTLLLCQLRSCLSVECCKSDSRKLI